MKLEKSVSRAVATIVAITLSLLGGAFFVTGLRTTYAEGEEKEASQEYFVSIYDRGEKLTIKTATATVGEVLSRVGIELESSDIVEPTVESKIDSDNFFINIYRARPVIIKDGTIEKYIMVASYDTKIMARKAGLTVYDGDEIKMAKNTNFLEAGMVEVYEIIRNGGRMVTEEEEIAFDEQIIKDYNLSPGTKEVRQLGEIGLKTLTYEVFYENGVETKREFIGEEIKREPVTRIVAIGVSEIERTPLTAVRGRNRYTIRKSDGTIVERQETYYDLPMRGVMEIAARECGVEPYYTVREDGVKIDAEGYVLVAAHLGYYPRCSVVETSLGVGRVYDTGSFADTNPEQFDIATDWTNRNGS